MVNNMSNLRLIVAVAMACAMTAGAAFADSQQSRLRELVVEFSDLIDPDSVKFRKLRFTDFAYAAWCGELNARNRLGGYVGWTKFVARDRRHGPTNNPRRFVEFILADSSGLDIVERGCRKDRNYYREDWQ